MPATFPGAVNPAAWIIFIVTIAVSLIAFKSPALLNRLLLRPYAVLRQRQYERLFTCGFVHADFAHLFLNMLSFWFFAFQLERAMGTTRFLVLYALALLISSLATCLKRRNDPDYASLGASGAVLAVLFASIIYFPTQSLFIMPIPVPIPAPLFALCYLGYSWWAARRSRRVPGDRINHDAHVDGALTGVVFVALTDSRALAAFVRYLL